MDTRDIDLAAFLCAVLPQRDGPHFACADCPYVAPNVETLQHHARLHIVLTLRPCLVCNLGFRTDGAFAQHVATAHAPVLWYTPLATVTITGPRIDNVS